MPRPETAAINARRNSQHVASTTTSCPIDDGNKSQRHELLYIFILCKKSPPRRLPLSVFLTVSQEQTTMVGGWVGRALNRRLRGGPNSSSCNLWLPVRAIHRLALLHSTENSIAPLIRGVAC